MKNKKVVLAAFIHGEMFRYRKVEFRDEDDYEIRLPDEIDEFETEDTCDYVAVFDEEDIQGLLEELNK
jgi:N-acyl-L-homoserine lactone synthetase